MRRFKLSLMATAAFGLATAFTVPALAQQPATAQAPKETPWTNRSLDAHTRTELLLKEMTQAEKLTLVFSHFASDGEWLNKRGDIAGLNWTQPKESRHQSAGFTYGVERLGIPHQWITDAGVGVASQRGPNPRLRTVLPSGMATAATWDRKLAFAGGAMIGKEARLSGFNVQLAGGVNLMREPRNGRNFEYGGEDPLLAGIMVGEQIRGIQSNHIVSTVKHYATNPQETNRFTISSNLSDQAARQSDLLAFEFAIEVGNPGSVMCAYNRYNGVYACENPYLLDEVLKTDWGYKGYVMSDWGATHSTIPAANAGLDQQSGYPFDKGNYFAGPLKEAVDNGYVKPERLDDMARRILWALFSTGVMDNPIATEISDANIDFAAHAAVTQADAEGGIVLLKNERNLLPVAATAKKIVVIGGNADKGVLSGGGSSQVYGVGGNAVPDTSKYANEFPGPITWYPDAPLTALKARTKADVVFHDGKDVKAAAKAARGADLVIVFGSQWTGESFDAELKLDHDGDALIAAVAKANKKTVVVLQTGGPVFMPWLKDVGAVVEAWYPGSKGGTAIARVLTGEVSPSGRLPVTFPAALSQLPRPKLDGDMTKPDLRPDANYDIEGAAIGYKWFDKKGLKPLFAFGHGLSYSSFGYTDLKTSTAGDKLSVSFTVTNTGKTAASDIPQVYVSAPASANWEAPKRLGGWDKVTLQPGESKGVTVTVDPRLLATFDTVSKTWNVAAGDYEVILARSAADPVTKATATLSPRKYDVRGK
ncbi:beta-glucosidase [Asticcacaulis sp. AND118]|uniref:beta-glucosidase family protein n=1 Tax=Asticcacaulis sp. AND118 TaxID=2840468 RepID=UPI001CFFE349|nr:glycoside hydrolase family 3 C-terminal domain-containing protein [Asticcacaulis sp. AND118]UDF02796.1 glycoside hydrolase family 3 C-terminal domain-containing protein [Asticcacaulis sp. AND118]